MYTCYLNMVEDARSRRPTNPCHFYNSNHPSDVRNFDPCPISSIPYQSRIVFKAAEPFLKKRKDLASPTKHRSIVEHPVTVGDSNS